MPQGQQGLFAERRAAVLSKLVQLFAQGSDPVELAKDAVNLVAHATDTAAVFVYLWDPEEERLVLRVATEVRQQRNVGEIRLRLGEGIAGWAALRQKSVIIDRDLHKDPRYIDSGQIDEEEFNSVLAVPIADEQSQLRGVFALYSNDEAAFGEDELAIAVEVGGLLATGLVRADTIDSLAHQSAIAHFLLDFPTAARISLASCLQFAARRLIELLDADVCVVEYMSRKESGAAPIVFASRSDSGDHRVWSTHSRATAQTNIDQNCSGLEHMSVSLGSGASRGIISCYRKSRFRTRDVERMSVLATQLGVLLEAVDLNSLGSSLADRLLLTQDDAEAVRIMTDLGLEGPICAVLVRVRSVRGDWETASRSLKQALESAVGNRGRVLLHSTWGIVIADAPGEGMLMELIPQLLLATRQLSEKIGLRVFIGIGSLAQTTIQIRQSIENAREALAWAEAYDSSTPVSLTSYSDIYDVLHLPEVMRSMTPTVVERVRMIEPLSRYDLEQGSQLVRTLSVLASCGGSVNQTASQLVIHRNTLHQRLQRIGQVLGISLDAETDWSVLTLATRVAVARLDPQRTSSS